MSETTPPTTPPFQGLEPVTPRSSTAPPLPNQPLRSIRVTNIPRDWDRNKLQQALESALDGPFAISTYSRSAFPRDPYNVALVLTQHIRQFQYIRLPHPYSVQLDLDAECIGLTTVSEPSDEEASEAEYITRCQPDLETGS